MADLTRAEAEMLHDSEWWKGVPAEQAALFQLNTERLCMPFGEFQRVVGEAIGRPVWTHEFVKPDRLEDEILGDREPPEDPNAHALATLMETAREAKEETG